MTKPHSLAALAAPSAAKAPQAAAETAATARAGRAAPPADAPAPFQAVLAESAARTAPMHASKSGTLKPEQQFEGFMLRSFIESMLPSENSSFFGEGTAGGIWKSMMAERIGDEMAAAGGIGIADMLAERASAKAARAAGEDALKDKALDRGAVAFRGL